MACTCKNKCGSPQNGHEMVELLDKIASMVTDRLTIKSSMIANRQL